MKIGLIGCGNIGKFLLEAINTQKVIPHSRIEWIHDTREKSKAKLEALAYEFGTAFTSSKEEFLKTDIQLVIECTEPEVAKSYAMAVVNAGKNLLMVSVGALVEETYFTQLVDVCREKGVKLIIPSGAIGGLDVLASASMLSTPEIIRLTTRKPPEALSLQPETNEPKVVFSGTAAEAIAHYPKNMNVAITLSLAGVGVENTLVELIADPTITRNIHEILIRGEFGRTTIQLENLPLPENPKTSYLTVLSILSSLKRLENPVQIGL